MNADEVQLKFDGMGISFLRQSSATTVHSKAVASLSVGPVARGPSANECISNIMDRFYCCNHAKCQGCGGRAVDVWQSWRAHRIQRDQSTSSFQNLWHIKRVVPRTSVHMRGHSFCNASLLSTTHAAKQRGASPVAYKRALTMDAPF